MMNNSQLFLEDVDDDRVVFRQLGDDGVVVADSNIRDGVMGLLGSGESITMATIERLRAEYRERQAVEQAKQDRLKQEREAELFEQSKLLELANSKSVVVVDKPSFIQKLKLLYQGFFR